MSGSDRPHRRTRGVGTRTDLDNADDFSIGKLWALLGMGVVALLIAGGVLLWMGGDDGQTPASRAGQAYPGHTELRWTELIPAQWDPTKRFKGKAIDEASDSDPIAQELSRQMRETWDNAPTNRALDGRKVVLTGYVVPLQSDKGELKEFLLVPYFGACIHVPPPPANQIVQVSLRVPVKDLRTMSSVRVIGTLRTQRQDSSMGVSGYAMEADGVEKYSTGRSFWSDVASRGR